MGLQLPPLYHWSPSDRRESIRKGGLTIFAEPSRPDGANRFAYICLGTDPAGAWRLSGDMDWMQEIESWDLWQVELAKGDEIHYRADFGPVLEEIRTYSAIPAGRCWLVGSRDGEHPAAQ